MRRIKMFCFPYAGGSSAVYAKWRDCLDRHIECYPIELKGRGRRIGEPLDKNLNETLDDVFYQIRDHIRYSHYVLFGHSLGALIAYELAFKIKRLGISGPEHVFLSGRGALHIPRRSEDKVIHLLPDDEFKKEIMEMGGTPKEFFDYPELLEILVPMLRNDFKISREYEYPHGENVVPLDCEISVLLGKEEKITAEQSFGWRLHTNKVCRVHYFNGGHFFINTEMNQVISIINDTLVPKK